MRLHKDLYVLRQAARAWKDELRRMVSGLGFTKSDYDESLYIRME